MKVVILAGGLGSRLAEETDVKPKPMVEIGGQPILWHIMKIYSHYGIQDFIICLGYKGYVIKEYFANYFIHTSDITFDMGNNRMEVHQRHAEPWRVTLIDTGLHSLTGDRLKRVAPYLDPHEDFCFTYGDGVGNVDLHALIAYHRQRGRLVTLTATHPTGRFGTLELEEGLVTSFKEKPEDQSWINGGFFVLSPKVLEYIEGEGVMWEWGPLPLLAAQNQVAAYQHHGFWQPMDTLRDKKSLEELWLNNRAPWKVWT